MGKKSLNEQFDDLSAALDKANAKCGVAYSAWVAACEDSKRIASARREVWLKMIDGVSRGQQ